MSSVSLNAKNHSGNLKVNPEHGTKADNNYFGYFIKLPTDLQYCIFELIGGIGTQVSMLNSLTDLQNIIIKRKVMEANHFFSTAAEGSPAKIAFNAAEKKISLDENITNLALEILLNMLDDSERTTIEEKFGLYSLGIEKIKAVQKIILNRSLMTMWFQIVNELALLQLPDIPIINNLKVIREWFEDKKTFLEQVDPLRINLHSLIIIPPEIKYLTTIVELYLGERQITDITHIKHLKNIEYLNLIHNKISDLNPLKNLKNLKYLNLIDNQISDLTPLNNLENLKQLFLTNNQIRNVTPLQNLESLQSLDLNKNQIVDITPLNNLENLIDIDISFNWVVDITPLNNLKDLIELNLSNNPISNLTPLEDLEKLKELHLANCEVNDITPIMRLINKQFFNPYIHRTLIIFK